MGAKEKEEGEYMKMLTRMEGALQIDRFVEELGSIRSAGEFERELEMEAVADE